jgi:phosphatidylglycerophosphatase A
VNDRLKLMLTTVGGLGLAPKAPGTFGSIPAAVVCFALLALHVDHAIYLAVMIGICVGSSVLCVALTPWSERRFSKADPRAMVLDEVAGQSLAVLLAPAVAFESVPAAALFAAIAFILFRVLDITKPGFIDTMQRLPRGWGVLLDDLAAGAGALAILFVGWNLFA